MMSFCAWNTVVFSLSLIGRYLLSKSTCLTVLLLAHSVFPLKCYQCNSSSVDLKPTCDRLYWKQMTTKERDDLIIDCLERLSYFCIVIRKTVGTAVLTTRGCMGVRDTKGTSLSAGCVDVSDEEKACLCTDNLCNMASGPHCTMWTFMTPLVFTLLSSGVLTLQRYWS